MPQSTMHLLSVGCNYHRLAFAFGVVRILMLVYDVVTN